MKRISIFLILTFVLTWAAEFYLWRNGGLENPSVQLFLMGIMLIPAISVFLTRWATGEGFHDMWLRLDIKKNYRIYLAAWLGPCVLIILGSVIYFLLFRSNFDPEMTVLRESMKTVQTEEPAEITTKVLIYTILTQCLISVVFAPILNIVPSLGEEIGWRGYLLPKLNTMFSRKKTVLLTGLIWGVWHAPIVAMGYNYGKNYFGYPFFRHFGDDCFLYCGWFILFLACIQCSQCNSFSDCPWSAERICQYRDFLFERFSGSFFGAIPDRNHRRDRIYRCRISLFQTN